MGSRPKLIGGRAITPDEAIVSTQNFHKRGKISICEALKYTK